MALGPEHIKQIDTAALKEIEALIDRVIKVAPPGTRTIYVTPPRHFSISLMPAIEQMYRGARWARVEYFSDQRDGDSIILYMDPR